MTNYQYIDEVEIEKFNPYHGSDGRFTHAGGASSFTIRTRAGYQQGQANRAIEREKQKADKPNSNPLRNPTGDHKKDLKTEWENADYAVQFKSDGTSIGIIDLHSERRTGANGDESWAEGAYGNAKIQTQYGGHSPIYMIDRKSAVEAEQAAYKKAKEKNIEDRGEVTKLLQDEIRQRMLRSIDKEYIDEQTKKRRQLRRQRDVGKSSGDYDLIEEVQKENKWRDPKTGRFRNKPGDVGNSTRSYGKTDLKDAVEENERASASGSKFRNSLQGHVDKNGRLTPEREAVHKKIIDDILAGKEPAKGQATMTMLGGGPASGKSSVMSADTSNDKHAITVDPDYIKTKLPGYKELSKKSSDAANVFHEESSALAKRLASVAYNENFNVIYDGTGDGSNNSVRKKIKAARERGYAVNAVYVSVDTETAVARNKKRYEDAVAKGKNPRLVPEDTVRNIHRNCTDISVSMAPEFDHIEIWDNNGARGQQKIIAEGGSGKGLVAKDKEKFDNYLSKGNRGKDGFTTLPDGQVIPVSD